MSLVKRIENGTNSIFWIKPCRQEEFDGLQRPLQALNAPSQSFIMSRSIWNLFLCSYLITVNTFELVGFFRSMNLKNHFIKKTIIFPIHANVKIKIKIFHSRICMPY